MNEIIVAELPVQALDLFIFQFGIDQNPALAYLRTRIPCGSYMEALEKGSELLALPYVATRVAAMVSALPDRAQITKDRAAVHLAAIAFADPIDFFEKMPVKDDDGNEVTVEVLKSISDMSPRARMAISSFDFNGAKREVKTYDKLRALAMLSDIMGWKDKTEDKKTASEVFTDAELSELKSMASGGTQNARPPVIIVNGKD